MDADLSAYTGLQSVTITGSASGTPGMLYFANGTDGYLKIRTGYYLQGTNVTNKGRLLANSNGTWGTTTPLQQSNKAVIDLQGTAQLVGAHLDVALYCSTPTTKYVEVYKTAYSCVDQTTGINTTTDVITFSTAPPTGGTAVRVRSSGTLPDGLSADYIYYVRSVSGTTCKLALSNADACLVHITSTGSGPLTMYDGHTSTSTAVVNVVQDVTGESAYWTTTSGHNYVALVDLGTETYDQQRQTISDITSSTLTLNANVDSVQWPLAKVWLLSRNVRIIGNTGSSSQTLIDFSTASLRSGIFNCQMGNLNGSGGKNTTSTPAFVGPFNKFKSADFNDLNLGPWTWA
jgi:hypothetical protein